MKSLVLITDAPAVGNLVSTALGHQPPGAETYTVPLSPAGAAPATHYGCHTWATEGFVDALGACVAQTALPPAPWGAVGLDETAVYAFCMDLIHSARDTDEPLAHFNEVIAAHGLQKVVDL